MKNKKPFWTRRSPKGAAPAPRTREEIQDLYNRACNEKGDLHYKVLAMSERIDELTQFQRELNAERQELDRRERLAQEASEREADLPTAPPAPAEQH